MAASKKKSKKTGARASVNRPVRHILSLDGGGVRGVITATWLAALEERLDGPLHGYFDLVAGTSTGSILAAAVGNGIPARKIVELYRDRAQFIFPKRSAWNVFGKAWDWMSKTVEHGVSHPKYDPDGLHKELKRVFKTTRLEALKTRVLVPSYDTLTRQAVIFKTTNPRHKKLEVWQVCTASSSAPTYFPAHVMKLGSAKAPLVDGGVVANNPTACAIAEAIKLRTDAKTDRGTVLDDLLVVSMGTGETTRPITIDDATEWGPIEWAIPVIDVLFDGAADAVSYIAAQAVGKDNYERLQVKLTSAYDDMDNASATNLNALQLQAEAYLRDGGNEQLDRIAARLQGA